MPITETSLKLFLELARDAGNWSGTPMLGHNVGTDRASRGNVTQLKRAGLITTQTDNGDTFVIFTEQGVALAAEHDVSIDR